MKNVLVIGGSKGIGLELVKSLIHDNKVVSLSRSENQFVHPNLTHITCDVLNDDLPELEVLDILIYCPGSINLKPFNKITVSDFKDEFDINFFGAVLAIQKYLPVLKKSNVASVLLFSTVAVKVGMPFHTGISSAKGAVEGLVKSLASEFAPKIRVNAIAPTLTDTSLAEKILRNEKMREVSAERHPLKSFLQPNEVADMATFLVSDRSKSISGQIITMDYGLANLKV